MSSDPEDLIRLAEKLDEARLTANSMDETAPQSGVYGNISDALRGTLVHIVGPYAAYPAYQDMIESGLTVREVIKRLA